jgi:hypothetical protein
MGTVTAQGGSPVEGAEIALDSVWRARTDARGRFRLNEVSVAVHLMEVRAVGFQPLALDLHVKQAETLRLAVTLLPAAQVLPEVAVTGRQRRLEAVGYYARQATGRGRFVSGDSLARLDSTSFVWAVARLRGIHARDPGGLDPQPASIACRGGFTLIVNGWRVPDRDDEGFSYKANYLRTLHPNDIEAIEIYEDASIPNIAGKALQLGPPSVPDPPAMAGGVPTRTPTNATPRSCMLVVWERQ